MTSSVGHARIAVADVISNGAAKRLDKLWRTLEPTQSSCPGFYVLWRMMNPLMGLRHLQARACGCDRPHPALSRCSSRFGGPHPATICRSKSLSLLTGGLSPKTPFASGSVIQEVATEGSVVGNVEPFRFIKRRRRNVLLQDLDVVHQAHGPEQANPVSFVPVVTSEEDRRGVLPRAAMPGRALPYVTELAVSWVEETVDDEARAIHGSSSPSAAPPCACTARRPREWRFHRRGRSSTIQSGACRGSASARCSG